MTASHDIIAALRRLGGAATVSELAAEAGMSHRTALRAVAALEASETVCVDRGGGRGRETTVRAITDTIQKLRRVTEIPNRIYEDPADLTPGAEYNPIPPDRLDEVRRDRARMMFARTGRWPSWAEKECR